MAGSFDDGRLGKPKSDVYNRLITDPILGQELKRLTYFCRVDRAHLVMLVEEGIVQPGTGSKLFSALADWEKLSQAERPIRSSLNTYLFQLESYLAERVGADTAGRLHTARGRADYGSTVLTLQARDLITEVLRALLRFQRELLALAYQHVQTLMPGYTHMQRSQPQTFGYYLLSHYFPLERDFERIRQCLERLNSNSLGCVARSGSGWPISRERTAELLGFDKLVENGHDQVLYRREHLAEIASCFSILMLGLDRLAVDLDTWSSEEFGFLEIDSSMAGSSSVMPQKKNGEPFERCRALAGEAMGWFPAAMGVLRLPSSSSGDPSYSELHDGGLVVSASTAVRSALELLGETLRTMTVYEGEMERSAYESWITASNLADVIVRRSGMSFRSAHRIVALLVGRQLSNGQDATRTTSKMVDEAATEVIGQPVALGEIEVQQALDPRAFIETRLTSGSPNPADVAGVLDRVASRLESHELWLERFEASIAEASSKLESAVARICDSNGEGRV